MATSAATAERPPVEARAASEPAPVEARAAAAPAPPPAADAAPLSAYLEPIVERNLFDSAASEKEEAPTVQPESTAPQQSELKARLVSTSVASDPAWSSCLIATDPKGPVAVYRIGDAVLGTVIEDIQRGGVDAEGKRVAGRVFLRGRAGVEFLVVDNPPPKKVVKKKKRKRRKRRKRSRSRRRSRRR